MSAEEQTRFLQELAEDLNSKNIELPSFPDVVISIRTALEDPACSSERLAEVVRTDPVLVARLLMSANSAFHNRAGIEITDLNLAISRLGFEVVRNTAITLAVEQIFSASQHEELKYAVKEVWINSLSLASMSFVVARNSGSVNPDNAFLCGLLHEIGKLYILTKAQDFPALMGDEESLATVMQQWCASVGRSIVEAWGFSTEIADSLEIEEHLSDDTGAAPSLVDVLFMAREILADSEAEEFAEACDAPSARLKIKSELLPAINEEYGLHSASMRQSVAA
jgi:HD-like signal output (HDOD) protein